MLVYTMSLIVLRRPSFFASISEIIAGAMYLLCVYALGVYASNMFYIVYVPANEFRGWVYILQMNVISAIWGFPLSILLNVLAVIFLVENTDDHAGAIQLPGDE